MSENRTNPPSPDRSDEASLEGVLSEEAREALELLVDEFVERKRCGEQPAMQEYIDRRPDLESGIRRLFPAVTAIEGIKAGSQRSSTGRASLRGAQLEQLGDFRIIRELGRGGMGIVFEAEQESLGRRVAIKVLPKQVLWDEKHLRRFEREAQTAASLHHTNIVPVFGAGHDNGYHFYVMQLIDGAGLDADSRRFASARGMAGTRTVHGDVTPDGVSAANSPTRNKLAPAIGTAKTARFAATVVARLGIQAAEALDHAHQHGVLHRDVKPGNLILDSKGNLWVTDFGLATAMDPDHLTRSGEIAGTMQYMAPEHFSDGHIDARSDIYSLGITLYELLAGRPPFDAAQPGPLMRKIVAGDIPPLRQVASGVPRDLETIVAQAIAPEPKHRYPSAGELAEDLQRWLDDRPLLARRANIAEQTWRWCRRNRLVAALALTASLLFLLAITAVAVGYWRTSIALSGEREQRQKAETATTLGLEVLDEIYLQFSPNRFDSLAVMMQAHQGVDDRLVARPTPTPETAAILARMIRYYDRLAEQGERDADVRRKAAMAHGRVGDLHQQLGQFDLAAAAYRRAIDLYGATPSAVRDADTTMQSAILLNELGLAQVGLRSFADARRSHEQAANLLESLAANHGGLDQDYPYELARTYYFLARRELWLSPSTFNERGSMHGGQAMLGRAGGMGRAGGRMMGHPATPKAVPGTAGGNARDASSADQRSTAYLQKALDVLSPSPELSPSTSERSALLAIVWHDMGAAQLRAGHAEEARTGFQNAVAAQTRLCERFPASETYRIILAWLKRPLADILLERGELAEAQRLLEESRDVLHGQLEVGDELPYVYAPLSQTYERLANIYRQLGDSQRADDARTRANQCKLQMQRCGRGSPGMMHSGSPIPSL